MYARTLKRVSKTARSGKKVVFNPWNCDMCLGYNTYGRDQNKKGILNSMMHYLLVKGSKTGKYTFLGYGFFLSVEIGLFV